MRKIPGGYYIKARQIKDSWVAHAAPVVREVWDYLLREANHEDKKYNGFTVKRGQLFRSFRDIRDALHWMVGARKVRYSENQMKHTMKLLRSNRMIELTSQPRGNLITVLKYDEFQNPKNYESTTESTCESTSDQPRINQSSTAINKNDKELIYSGKSALDFFAPEMNGWDKTNVQKTIDGFISLRKTKQISAGVIESEFEYWCKYPDEIINKALNVYINGKYWEKTKGEKYLRGIIRGKSKEAEKSKNNPMFKRAF